jgi:very-short-patch-repair endonuclease
MNIASKNLEIDLIYTPIINFALQQNHVPVIRKLTIKNIGAVDLTNINIEIIPEPEFAVVWNKKMDGLPQDELVDLGAIDIKSITKYLAELTERIAGSFRLIIKAEGEVLFEDVYSIDVLAYEQWNGVTVLPEMLAAFITPNHPEIARVIIRASEILQKWTGKPSFDEYQSLNPDRVRKQMAAIYEAIAELNLVYCSVPASFEEAGQRIRLCDMIFSQKMANCLDISLLYASCLEAIGIHPLIIVIKGHAFVGGWLINETFPDSVNDDVSLLTKRTVDGINEIVLVEGTFMNAGNGAGFDKAVVDANYKLMKEDDFILFVDIKRARFSGIRPLPLRIQTLNGIEIVEPASQNRNSGIPEEIVPTAKLVDVEKLEISKKQIWERKLLDLTLRNNLLNLRITRNTVQLIFTQLPKLEDALAAGAELQILGKPSDWDNPLRNAGVYQSINVTDPIADLINHEFTQKRLRSYLPENELGASLTQLYRASRLSLEENGANTLYVSLGMLKWYETTESERPRYAPILLMPVEIIKKSAQRGFIIRTREEETMMNITLLEMLRQDFGINIGGLDNLPRDESGVDVRMVLNSIRQAIMTNKRWDVEEQIFLGIFSFSKFIMWNDIHQNTEQLSKNKIVSSLISGKIEWNIPENNNSGDFDELHHPANIVLPISADSSQLEAITESVKDQSFVLHGPPGTGKSQTITNIISNALYNGKKVLFVAEKMAALSVVRDRLENIGVGPFCLELHSNKSKKSAVLEQLKRTSEVVRTNSPENYRSEAERIHLLRGELNGYVKALHKKYPFGFSVFDCFSTDAQLETIPNEIKFSDSSLETLSRTDVTTWNDIVKEIQVAGSSLPHPHNHPLQIISVKSYSQQIKSDGAALLNQHQEAIQQYQANCNLLCAKQKLDTPIIYAKQFEAFNSIARLLITLPDISTSIFATDNVEQVVGKLTELCGHGAERDLLRTDLFKDFQQSILQLNGEELLAKWNLAETKWFLPKYFDKNGVKKLLRKLSLNGQIDEALVVPSLEKIIDFKKEQQIIDTNAGFLASLLGFLWKGGECNWPQLVLIANTIIHINREIIFVTGDTAKAKIWRQNIGNELSEGSRTFLAIHGKLLQDFTDSHLLVNSIQRKLTEILGVNFTPYKTDLVNYLTTVGHELKLALESIEQLKDWGAWLNTKDTALQAGLIPVITAYESGRIESPQVVNAFSKGLYRSCANYIIQKESALSLFNGKLFEEKIRRFREMTRYFEKLTKQELYAKLASKIPDFTKEAAQSSEIGLLQKTIRNSGRGMPIRKLFDAIPNLLPRIAPCMLMSPISVAQYFDAGAAKFDLVIFDEASQMPTCEAVGAIARAHNMIIVGDPKQMPPTSFFSSSNNVDEENIEKEDLESILDDCLALSMPSKHLLWHYRSKHESLIAFSNSKYYDNKLLTFPSPDDIATKVKFIPVEGYYDRGKTRQNSFEAKAVIDEIKRRLNDPILSKRSIGVVSFSSVQQSLMQNMFDELLRTNPALETIANDAAEPIFIKNLENVQGDERDVILFSMGYGPDKEGKVSLNFGPLNREGGWRRLNVAVSRARYEMQVFSTLRADQIDITRSASEGVASIKLFLEYAEKGRSTLGLRKAAPENVGGGFEKILAEKIRKHGYEVNTDIGCSGYRIDIGIVNSKKPSQYLLGILCDGVNYNAAKTAKDREIIQQEVLKLLGWTLHKVWSTDWWENADRVIQEILEAIKNAEANDGKEVIEAVNENTVVEPSKIDPLILNSVAQPTSIPASIAAVPPNRMYHVCNLAIVLSTTSEDFLQFSNGQKIKNQISQVLDIEAPITKNLLAKRLLSAWGISKLGARINAQFEKLLAESALTQTGKNGDIVFWKNTQHRDHYEGFRVMTIAGQKRDAEDIPAEEIANGVKEILTHQISLPKDDLVREASKLFGFARSGTNVENAMKKGIVKAVERGLVTEWEGRIIING